jgi:hypothetical protein
MPIIYKVYIASGIQTDFIFSNVYSTPMEAVDDAIARYPNYREVKKDE